MVIGSLIVIMGCAKAKPFDYHSDNEIPEGPGLFTKEKGEFVIYDSNKKKVESKETDQKVSASSSNPPASEESESFREFQEWKKDKEDFEAFQEWKNSQQGSQENQELEEWKRWREYKQWSDKQKKPNKIDY